MPGGKARAPVANVLPLASRVNIIAHLLDGCSIAATSRLVKCDKDVPMYLGVLVGRGCAILHDRLMRGVRMSLGEVDEVWAYVGRHEKRLRPFDPPEWGDNYTMFCVDAVSRIVPSYLTANRDGENATTFFRDLRSRTLGKPQVNVDGWPHWPDAARRAYGWNGVDMAVVIKEYQSPDYDPRNPDRKYSPSRVKSVEKHRALGKPDLDIAGTERAERLNLTGRMNMRRLTRLTNAYSRKRENLVAALHLHFFAYNFVRVHEAIGTTPAVAAGIADAPWSLTELVERALAALNETPEAPSPAPAPGTPPDAGPGPHKASGEPYRPMTQVRLPGIGSAPANDTAPADDDEAPATVRDPLPYGAQEG
jgi:hypothetical protein